MFKKKPYIFTVSIFSFTHIVSVVVGFSYQLSSDLERV